MAQAADPAGGDFNVFVANRRINSGVRRRVFADAAACTPQEFSYLFVRGLGKSR